MYLKLLLLCFAALSCCYADVQHEFGDGCEYVEGRCFKRCAKGTHEYSSACNPDIPTWSEPTCEQPAVRDLGTICDMSICYCDPPTIRDTINDKCVLPKDCPAPGSKPTGPPIDDSYLYVDQLTPPPPRESNPEPIQQKEEKLEFGVGCLYVNGRCHKRCPKGTYAYTSSCSPSTPTWSESTCENPMSRDIGAVCDMSLCKCEPPTVRDTINNKCVLLHECPPPGSEPTGPPIDDSYLLVNQDPTPHLDRPQITPISSEIEFGVGCQYIFGRCFKRCAKGTHGYMSACNPDIPTWSEPTCEQPLVKDLGPICDMSRCDCDPPTIRDTINNKCVLPKDCPAPGSKPTGPPIDDSYLLVKEPTPKRLRREPKPEPIPNKEDVPTQLKIEFGVGCQYINGRCYKRCAKGTHAYLSSCSTSHPTWSEMTCEEPVARDIGAICDMSRCDCDPPMIRDTINNKCVLPEDCPAPGSKPTGPPIDDSYLLVVEPTPMPPHQTGPNPIPNQNKEETEEFGVGCLYVDGRCHKRCPKGTYAYTSSCSPSTPTWSESTCENPVVKNIGAVCGLSRCECQSPTVRDTINNKCVLLHECPPPGSKPTGPPIDDSYLLVNQDATPTFTPPHLDRPLGFGIGCQYIRGTCYKRCAKGRHAYVSSCSAVRPTWSQLTCEQPVARDIGAICDLSRCDCDPPTILDTINNKCVLPEDCPQPGSKPTGPPIDESYLLVDIPPAPPLP